MMDVVDRAKDSLNTYDFTRSYGCEPGYPAGLVRSLVAEVKRLRDGINSIEKFCRIQALSDRARTGTVRGGYHSEERYWLDALAIIERVQAGAE